MWLVVGYSHNTDRHKFADPDCNFGKDISEYDSFIEPLCGPLLVYTLLLSLIDACQ